MSISGISNSTNVYAVKNNDPLSLKKAIKAYQDERLTGLTDEEREEIERRSKEYLEKNPIKTEQDRNAFNEYVKSLLKEFGFKSNIDEFAAAMAGDMQDKHEDSNRQPAQTNIAEHFNMSAMRGQAVKNKLFQ